MNGKNAQAENKVLQVLSGKRTLVDHVTSFVLSEYSWMLQMFMSMSVGKITENYCKC